MIISASVNATGDFKSNTGGEEEITYDRCEVLHIYKQKCMDIDADIKCVWGWVVIQVGSKGCRTVELILIGLWLLRWGHG